MRETVVGISATATADTDEWPAVGKCDGQRAGPARLTLRAATSRSCGMCRERHDAPGRIRAQPVGCVVPNSTAYLTGSSGERRRHQQEQKASEI